MCILQLKGLKYVHMWGLENGRRMTASRAIIFLLMNGRVWGPESWHVAIHSSK